MTQKCQTCNKSFKFLFAQILHHSSKFLVNDKDNIIVISKIANIWHFPTFRKEAMSVADIADFVQFCFSYWLHMDLWKRKNLASEMLTLCHTGHIKCDHRTLKNPNDFNKM